MIYNKTGQTYNATRKADPFIVDKLFQLMAPKPDQLYLDIGCGTGNYTIALADKGLKLYGVEPSEQMLKQARAKNPQIKWQTGTAEKIPCEHSLFDGVTATLTLHHWTNLEQSFKEISRVLKDKGKLVIFTSTQEQMKGYWLNKYFPGMLRSSIQQMPAYQDLEEAVKASGMVITAKEKYDIHKDLQDSFLYIGKNNPYLYFDEQIRNGISSFALSTDDNEIQEGLTGLSHDLEHDQFIDIKKSYANDLGDYVFITVEKK
jgi:ubiquinone/menaquinone biosynthesis C-methylase UbiE